MKVMLSWKIATSAWPFAHRLGSEVPETRATGENAQILRAKNRTVSDWLADKSMASTGVDAFSAHESRGPAEHQSRDELRHSRQLVVENNSFSVVRNSSPCTFL